MPLVALMIPALLLILLVLLDSLLLIPFHLSAQLERREGRSSMRFAVRGIIGFSRSTEDGETTSALQLLRRTAPKRREEKEEKKDKKKEKKKKGICTGDLLEVLPELPYLVGAIRRLLNALRRGGFTVGRHLGFDFPTGLRRGGVGGGAGDEAEAEAVEPRRPCHEAVPQGADPNADESKRRRMKTGCRNPWKTSQR